MATVFERCGGFATVRRIVSDFYDRVLDSSVLRHHFESVDMRRLIDHQTKFIAFAMGGPAAFNDDALERVHAPLAISRVEFREMATLLRDTLEDFDLPPEDVDAVLDEVMRRQERIVGQGD